MPVAEEDPDEGREMPRVSGEAEEVRWAGAVRASEARHLAVRYRLEVMRQCALVP